MDLELIGHRVTGAGLGERTVLRDGVLVVNRDELIRLLLQDERVASVTVAIARPGESCRIVHVLDAFEPRARIEPAGPAFPGVTGPPVMAGTGRVRRLEGAAVVLTGLPPGADDPSLFQESVVDMSGPGASLSPLSATVNVVLAVALDPALPFDDGVAAMRLAGARAAEYLAAAAGEAPVSGVERFALAPAAGGRPRVAVVLQLEAWGSLQRSFLYGMSVDGLVPTLLHPNEVLDGALTCGTYHLPSIRHVTYLLQNHAILRELYRRHAAGELEFAGVVVQRALWASDDDKRRSADFTAKLLRHLGVSGAIVTFAHGGHAVTDLVLTCQACERQGVKVASLMFEMAGEDGFDFGLVQGVSGAEPLVSTGNIYASVRLPPVERTLGGEELHGLGGHAASRRPAREAVDLPLRHIIGVSGPAGSGRLTTRAG